MYDTNKWKHRPSSWTRRIKIVKMVMPPSVIYIVNAKHIKISITFFTEIEKKSLNLYGATKDPQ